MPTSPHARGLSAPADPPRGRARVPSSKSEALRAILLAARADWAPVGRAPRDAGGAAADAVGRGRFAVGPLRPGAFGEDVERALGIARALGAEVELLEAGPGGVPCALIRPRAGDHAPAQQLAFDVGESATLARFATAIAGLDPHCQETRVFGRGTLGRRRSPALFRALARKGVALEFEGARNGWPVVVRRAAPKLGRLVIESPSSSQEVSALLLAGGGPDARHVPVEVRGRIPSRPYLDLTVRMMRRFGMGTTVLPATAEGAAGEGLALGIHPLDRPADGTIDLAADASLAAVILALACLTDGDLVVPGVPVDCAQGDVRIVAHLNAFGCAAVHDARGLSARGRPTRGADVDLGGEPDLAPILAVVALDAALRLGEPSRLRGLGTLAGKESDRLAGTAAALEAAGVRVHVRPDELKLEPGGARAGDLVLDARGDHRMAYLHALLGLVVPGVLTADGRCVAKTWPAFWEDVAALGVPVIAGA